MLQLCAVDFTVYHFLLPLARELSADYDVHFATSAGPYVDEIRGEGFVYHCIPVKRSYDVFSHMRTLFHLRRLMRRERFDIVHTHTPIAGLIGRLAARAAGVPVVLYTAHGFYFHDRMSRSRRLLFVWLEKIGGRFCDFIFTQSAEDFADARSLGIARENALLHIGNGIDLERFDAGRLRGRRNAFRSELGIRDDDLVVCMVGRLVREKGYLELIDAFDRVAKEMPRCRLVVVGGALTSEHDDASAEISSRVRSRGLGKNVLFLSFQKGVEHVLCASDVFVLPSHREGMPRSLIEAMAMELPVVTTNVRGCREAVVGGVTGTIVEVGDADGLAAALLDLLRDPAKRLAYGRAGRERARRLFDERAVIREQIAVIDRLFAACVARRS